MLESASLRVLQRHVRLPYGRRLRYFNIYGPRMDIHEQVTRKC